MTSIQVLATPTSGRDRSSSVNPTALSMARAGARPGPSTRSRLLRFGWLVMWSPYPSGSRRPRLFPEAILIAFAPFSPEASYAGNPPTHELEILFDFKALQ